MTGCYGKLAAMAGVLALSACANETAPTAQGGDQTAQAGAVEAASDQPGPAVGDLAPVKTMLTDASGKPVSVLDMAGDKGVVLVFNRSLSWCPYCKAQAIKLNGMADAITARGYGLSVLTYDTPDKLAGFAEAESIRYPLLSDPKSSVIDAFAIRDPQYTEGKAVGVPYASIFILSPDGTVLAKSVSSDYKVRPNDDEVLALLADADKAGQPKG